MWTEITRPKYERTGQRYASDLTDREWAVIAPFMPAPKRLGRPRETDLRAVLDAILYMARSGCQWRYRRTFRRSRRCRRHPKRRAARYDAVPSRSSNNRRTCRQLSAPAAPLDRRTHPCLAHRNRHLTMDLSRAPQPGFT
jgi:transposase